MRLKRAAVPLPLRRLRSEMVLKAIEVRELSEKADIPYSTVSAVLNGRLVHGEYLARLQGMISESPVPQ